MKEHWKGIKNFGNYEVSDFGNVRNIKTQRILKPYSNTKTNYFQIGFVKNKKQYRISVHRLVAIAFLPKEKQNNKSDIDHIDGDKHNNNLSNLRFASRSENNMNRNKQKNSTSIYKGVCYITKRKKWLARITIKDKKIHIGYFKTEKEGAIAYNKKAIELCSKYAKLNVIDE